MSEINTPKTAEIKSHIYMFASIVARHIGCNDRDAAQFAETMMDPAGGEGVPEHVKQLIEPHIELFDMRAEQGLTRNPEHDKEAVSVLRRTIFISTIDQETTHEDVARAFIRLSEQPAERQLARYGMVTTEASSQKETSETQATDRALRSMGLEEASRYELGIMPENTD